nr:retrotransposon protein, putative, Ty3-gypsy subclass [Tanacetum cinerariifolium]
PMRIREAQEGAMKKKYVRKENLRKLIKLIFEFCPDGNHCFGNRVKAEHQKPSGLLQQLEISVWKWERITMDFVSELLRMPSGHFTSRFSRSLQEALGTNLDMSIAYHPQTDGQSERTIQTLEDMLCAWIHSTFHVSNLKKCLAEDDFVVLIDEIQHDDKLHMIKEPVEVMDREVKKLKQSRIPIVKIRKDKARKSG